MCLPPSEEIGTETHHENDQFFRFESGEGRVTINGEIYDVHDGDSVVVPMGAEHNVVNISQMSHSSSTPSTHQRTTRTVPFIKQKKRRCATRKSILMERQASSEEEGGAKKWPWAIFSRPQSPEYPTTLHICPLGYMVVPSHFNQEFERL
ncbi:cupin domain-containing protein [Nostocoides sp.]